MNLIRLIRLTTAMLCLVAIGGTAIAGDSSTLLLSGGVTRPLSPELGYDDQFDGGLHLGVHYRRALGTNVHIVGEVGYSQTNNGAPAIAFPLICCFDVRNLDGGDLDSYRFSAGIAVGTARDGVNVFAKVLAGVYGLSVGDVTYEMRLVGEEWRTISVDAGDFGSDTRFGLNLGAWLEVPVSASTLIFAGTDLDLVSSPEVFLLQNERLTDLTARGGVGFRF